MQFAKHLGLVIGLAGALLGVTPAAGQTVQHVEFSEVNLPSLTDLTGRNDFSPFGLSFQNTQYVIFPRLVGAGNDDRGIATPGVGTIFFSSDASDLTIATNRILGSDFRATAFDVNHNVLQVLTLGPSGVGQAVHAPLSFTGVTGIRSLEFRPTNINGTFVEIGRPDYTLGPTATTVPEPSTAALLLPALGALPLWTLRRKRKRPTC